MTRRTIHRAVPVFLLALTAGCAEQEPADDVDVSGEAAAAAPDTMAGAPAPAITVRIEPTEGNQVEGTVTLTETPAGVRVTAEISGLTEGDHGFHIHETGDCSAPDASSAGGHFAPDSSRHGGPDEHAPNAHAGDLGNLQASGSGEASFDEEFDDITFEGHTGVIGRAIVIHAGADDFTSQPSGDAGDRVACGVISRPG